jgi:hypothetical protein
MKKYYFLTFLLSILLLISFVSGCVKASMEDTGIIKFVDLEGGFYGIVGDNGQKFDPVNLRKEFKKEGLKVKFVYTLKKSTSNVHQWGRIIEILSIRKI